MSDDRFIRRAAVPLLALTVGAVLADSAIVTLALPEVLRRLGGTVTQVAWVLIAFNLVLAVVVVPAAWLCARRNPAPVSAVAIAVFAGSSAACALAGSLGVLIAAPLTVRATPVHVSDRHRPALLPNVALLLLSAALTAALFLLVLLLVDGWGRSPAIAALTVSVVPVAAFAARPLARVARAGPRSETAAGCLLIAGGLVGLALPPSADLGWTIAPQALVGLGLGLTVDALTSAALRDRFPRALHGGWTIGARHAGVVLGLAILTPVFSSDLTDAQVPAEEAITAHVLDAPLRAQDKIALARGLSDQLKKEDGRVPDLHPAFATLRLPPAERPAARQLERDLTGQLERAASRAFRDSFLIGAALAVAALASLIPLRRRRQAMT
jgi:hypothetical protein